MVMVSVWIDILFIIAKHFDWKMVHRVKSSELRIASVSVAMFMISFRGLFITTNLILLSAKPLLSH